MSSVIVDEQHKPVLVITINRPHVRNAVDGPTARQLHDAFVAFARDDQFKVAILRGEGGHFCAGADLQAVFQDQKGTEGSSGRSNDLNSDMDAPGPMGPTRLVLSKPVIACIDGYAVAGGLEMACWCDLRVASQSAQFGVLCRLRGVPLIDGGTVRLPKLIGLSRAQDLILTGRVIGAEEAERMSLVNRVVPSSDPNEVLAAAFQMAQTLCKHPQECMRGDRLSMLSCPELKDGFANVSGAERKAMQLEFEHGLRSMQHLGPALEAFLKRDKQARL